jgi:CHASE2 domain-containing sensor protein
MLTDGGEVIALDAALHGPSGRQTRELAERLCADPRVLGFKIEPRNP